MGGSPMLGPLIAFVLGIGASLATGGRLERLGEVPFRRLVLFWPAVGATAALTLGTGWVADHGVELVLICNAFFIAFAVANRHLPGFLLVAVGISLNALVIAANGAMPVSVGAAEQVASTQVVGGVKHEPMTDDTHLALLADRVPVGPSSQVWSIGDFILVAGIGWMSFALPRRRERVFTADPGRSSGVVA
jgi:hypothetical protein